MDAPHGDYLISDDPARLDLKAIHAHLGQEYWSKNIPYEVMQRAVAGSLCLGAYDAHGNQVGLARFISDFATFCYVCDVYVLPPHRGHGLAKALMQLADRHPKLQGLRRWNLVTRDAHGLYAQHGFRAIAHPERYMERLDPDVYQRTAHRADPSS
ncbi:MAG: GNAT family N-acetyltransferase [Opitutae bacterium]